jgi:hypothetical protein
MLKGLQITGVFGKQRSFFNVGPGIVRGIDGELLVEDFLKNFGDNISILPEGWRLRFGGGVVSKYEQDTDPTLNLPENVLAYNTRMTFQADGFALDAEYAYKINDPKTTNVNTFNPGRALYVNASYSAPGIGINVSLKSLDNMDFRSSRRSQLTDLVLNYLPAVTKQYTYRLLTLYPYATQPNGEIGVQADLLYTFPKGSFLGGKYGTSININYARVHSIDSTRNLSDSTAIEGNLYNTNFLSFGRRVFFDDINVEIQKKWSKDFKTNFGYMRQYYLKELIELLPGTGAIKTDVITQQRQFVSNCNIWLLSTEKLMQMVMTKKQRRTQMVLPFLQNWTIIMVVGFTLWLNTLSHLNGSSQSSMNIIMAMKIPIAD